MLAPPSRLLGGAMAGLAPPLDPLVGRSLCRCRCGRTLSSSVRWGRPASLAADTWRTPRFSGGPERADGGGTGEAGRSAVQLRGGPLALGRVLRRHCRR